MAIDASRSVDTGDRADGSRLAEVETRCVERINARIEQRATALRRVPADIGGVKRRGVGEGAFQVEWLPDLAARHDRGDTRVLRMVAVHEALHQPQTRRARRIRRAHGIRERECAGLVAQNVLARIERAERPLSVLVVWEWNVNSFDIRVGEQGFVGAIGARDALTRGDGLRLAERARGDRDERRRVRDGAETRDHTPLEDAGAAQYAPSDGFSIGRHLRHFSGTAAPSTGRRSAAPARATGGNAPRPGRRGARTRSRSRT